MEIVIAVLINLGILFGGVGIDKKDVLKDDVKTNIIVDDNVVV